MWTVHLLINMNNLYLLINCRYLFLIYSRCLSLLHLGILMNKKFEDCIGKSKRVKVKMWVVKQVLRSVNKLVWNVHSLVIVLSLLQLAAALWYAWGFLWGRFRKASLEAGHSHTISLMPTCRPLMNTPCVCPAHRGSESERKSPWISDSVWSQICLSNFQHLAYLYNTHRCLSTLDFFCR